MNSTKEIQEFINKKGVCFNQYYSKEDELDILVCHKDTIKIEDIPQIIKKESCDTIEPKEEKEEVKECEHEWYGKRYCRKCGQIEMWGKITGNQAIDLENKMIIGEIITPTPNEWIENKMKEFHDKLKEHDESLCDTNMFIQPYKVEQFLKSSLTQQKEAIEKEWRKKIEQRIEIAKLCIDASAEGQDLGGGFTPKEELESETAIKVALEQLLQ